MTPTLPPAPAAVTALLRQGVADGTFPCAALFAARLGGGAFAAHVGRLTYAAEAPPLTPAARFDLASLTKPLGAVTVAMRGVAAGWLDLRTPVAAVLADFSTPPWHTVTLAHLLQHASGLVDWRPYFRDFRTAAPPAPPGGAAARDFFRQRLAAEPLVRVPGSSSLYSDLGFLVLGLALEALGGLPLPALVAREVAGPLGLGAAEFGYRATASWAPEQPPEAPETVVPTECCAWRGGLVHGVVHDENAHALGGVAPHAGLFATLGAVGRWAEALLEAALGRRPAFLPAPVVNAFFDAAPLPGATWHLGFDGTNPAGSAGGRRLSPDAVGHLGFTGTSVWLDRRAELGVVLLTNRVHPTRDNWRIRDFRPRLHDAVVGALRGG